jgi:hypothetical protein
MNVQEIQVNIDSNGKVSMSLQGIKGDACLGITSELEHLLGNEIVERKLKHEYYDPPTPMTNNLTAQNKK